MKKMRVLMICGDFPPALSGIGDYINLLCENVAQSGVDVTLLTTAFTPSSGTPGEGQGRGQNTSDVTGRSLAPRPGVPEGGVRILREMPHWGFNQRRKIIDIARDFDLVHMQYPSVKYGRGPAVNLIPMFLRAAGIPCVVTIHDFRVMRKRWCARVVPMLTFASALIHVDAGDGPYLRRWSPLRHAPMTHIPIASNAPVLPCDASTRAKWRRDLGIADDEFIVAHFGILYPHKGIPEMLDAVEAMQKEGRKVRALVVGDFDREADYVAPLSARLNAPGVVWVRGASLERVSECLHASDAAALPFHSGASFNRSSMLACLQHGLPTITTDGPATPKNLKDVYELLLVPIQNAAAVTTSLRALLDDAALRARLRGAALKSTETLNWPVVARRHVEFYSSVLSKPTAEVAREAAQRA